MPVAPNSLRQDELPEYPYVGPFGGVQSEVTSDKIGNRAFAEVQNVMFWKSRAQIFPAFVPLTSPSGEIIIGIADFYNVNGVRLSVVWTPTKMYYYTASSATWTQVLGASSFTVTGAVTSGTFIANEEVVQTGTGALANLISTVPGAGPMTIVGLTAGTAQANSSGTWTGTTSGAVFTPTAAPVATGATLGGSSLQFMQWDVVGYKLYFSQQYNTVMVWDGITGYYSPVSNVAVPAKYVCELNFQLLAANTLTGVGGTPNPNRVYWSAPGDGTNWTSFAAGQNDLFNGLGPINGLARIYQAGYAYQQFGICQIVPTGIGLSPFEFISMGSRAKGSILPYGVATFGEIISAYIGKNDVYVFDGTQSNGIGDKPIDGNRRLGARSRIFADLFNAAEGNCYSIIMSEANGNNYESFWLFIPSLNKAWIYHFDEMTWTQQYFIPSRLVGPAGILSLAQTPAWNQLVGTWQQQSWTWASLSNANPLDTMVISDANADSVAYLNFGTPSSAPTNASINANDGWYIRSGQLEFDDPRHGHTAKKIRVSMLDFGAITVSFRFTNEFGQQAKWPTADGSNTATTVYSLSYGTNSGSVLKFVIPVSLQGKYITWEMSGPQGVGWGMSEITAVYDISGEVQNNR
jgi:hypothetical protein